jgi:hypothetical protein
MARCRHPHQCSSTSFQSCHMCAVDLVITMLMPLLYVLTYHLNAKGVPTYEILEQPPRYMGTNIVPVLSLLSFRFTVSTFALGQRLNINYDLIGALGEAVQGFLGVFCTPVESVGLAAICMVSP